MKTEHALRSQVIIGPKSHCLLVQLKRTLEISDSVAGRKSKNSGVDIGKGECGDGVTELQASETQSLEILSENYEAKLSAIEVTEVKEGNGDAVI